MRICVKMDNFQNITKTGVRSSLQGNYTTGVVKYNAYKVILEIPLKEFDWISSFIKFSSRNKMLVFDNSLRKRENSCWCQQHCLSYVKVMPVYSQIPQVLIEMNHLSLTHNGLLYVFSTLPNIYTLSYCRLLSMDYNDIIYRYVFFYAILWLY